MDETSVVRFDKAGFVEDALTELVRGGAQCLIQQAVEAELAELLLRYPGETDRERRAVVVRNGYLPEREVIDRRRPVMVRVPKGALAHWRGGGVSRKPGAALRAPCKGGGGGTAVVVSEGVFHRGDGRGAVGADRP
jgi:hypothetical protein